MAKKKKEISLDDLEDELAEKEKEEAKAEEEEEEQEEEIEEIEEFNLDEITEEEQIEELFEEEEEVEGLEEVEEKVVPEEEIVDERIYMIPLAMARRGPRNKWAKKAIRYLREYVQRHFKPESLIISQEVNEKIWERGIKKPPRKIKVRATKNVDGLVVVYLA
ncbi:MAG: 50S ribosomal protein L31e [Promethearchaeota archaeon]